MKLIAFVISFVIAVLMGMCGKVLLGAIFVALAAFFLCWEITEDDDDDYKNY